MKAMRYTRPGPAREVLEPCELPLPEALVHPLPEAVALEVGACLGIPALTAWEAVHGGPTPLAGTPCGCRAERARWARPRSSWRAVHCAICRRNASRWPRLPPPTRPWNKAWAAARWC